jgi:hypothetical protein
LKVLEDRNVVEAVEGGEGDRLYAASLDGHPPWVAEAVAEHQDSDSARPDPLGSVRMMVGMECDECERLLRYRGQVIAVYLTDGERRAKVLPDYSPEAWAAVGFRIAEKYHRACYAQARERDPLLPPL